VLTMLEKTLTAVSAEAFAKDDILRKIRIVL